MCSSFRRFEGFVSFLYLGVLEGWGCGFRFIFYCGNFGLLDFFLGGMREGVFLGNYMCWVFRVFVFIVVLGYGLVSVSGGFWLVRGVRRFLC